MSEYPLYRIDQLLPLASQQLREQGLPDTAQNRYRILPQIRKQQLRSPHHERTNHECTPSTDTGNSLE